MKNSNQVAAPKTIDDYLVGLPEPVQIALENLRETIKELVPNAEEVIHYQIPTFKFHGPLVGFAAFKNHCSFFVMSTTLLDSFEEELKEFPHSGGTIHFQPEKPLPAELVEKMVLARMKMNEDKANAKKNK